MVFLFEISDMLCGHTVYAVMTVTVRFRLPIIEVSVHLPNDVVSLLTLHRDAHG